MSEELRVRILHLLDEHEATGSPYYLGDDELATATGQSVGITQSQLEILRSDGNIRLSIPLTEYWGARRMPKGKQRAEQVHGADLADRRIGFHPGA
jgi:hypothetical protein